MFLNLLFAFSFPALATNADAAQGPCAANLTRIVYGNIEFEIPELSKSGFILRPRATEVASELGQQPEVRSITDVWNFNHLLEAHQPVLIGQIDDREAFGRAGVSSVLDMPIKFPGTDYLIPDDLRQFAEAIQKTIDFEHAVNPRALKNYYAYLTVHQSWVEPGVTQRRPGLHVDGFQGAERPQKEAIEHSYLIANDVPTVYTTQRFHFWNFDFARFNIFADFDRQAEAQFEYASKPFGIYMGNAYAVHRADIATKKVLRTFFRLTYSVAIFDRLGLTDNPLFPYRWDRSQKDFQSKLERYVPPTGIEKLTALPSLSEIKGQRLGVVGIGEGSDGLQAAQIAALLADSGKTIEFVSSFRRSVAHLGGEDVSPGVVRVNKDFRMQARQWEAEFSERFPTYIHFDDTTNDLAAGLNRLIESYAIDGLVLVDGGGNVLSPMFLQKHLLNDHRTLLAAETVPVEHKTLVIVSPGINVPPQAHQVMAGLNATRYRPSLREREDILRRYEAWGMQFENPKTFAFIPMIWQQALRGEFGAQKFPPLHPHDPPYVVTPESQDLMIVPFDRAIDYVKRAE